MSEDIKVFKIKKAYLSGLATWLAKQKLEGRTSRERTRFVNSLTDAIKLLEKERQEIIGKFVEKEIDKKTKKEVWKKQTVENSTNWVIQKGKEEEFNAEIKGLYEEDYTLSVTAEHKDKMACIKDIVLNTKYVFGVDDFLPEPMKREKFIESTDYNVWCEAFENI